jgi:hypothetical protein
MSTSTSRAARTALRGALSGAVATVAMSGVMAVGRALGLYRTPPPQEITAAATQETTGWPPAATPAFRAGWLSAHLLYGMACGVLFSGLRQGGPGVPRQPLGLGFGLLVWGASYLGLMPALRLYPWPDQDTPGRLATMILAHLVFGASLAEIDGRLAPRP